MLICDNLTSTPALQRGRSMVKPKVTSMLQLFVVLPKYFKNEHSHAHDPVHVINMCGIMRMAVVFFLKYLGNVCKVRAELE